MQNSCQITLHRSKRSGTITRREHHKNCNRTKLRIMAVVSNNTSSRLLYTVGISLGVTMISAVSYWYYKYIKRDIIPEKWRRVGILENIYLFPVKSCAPLKLSADTEISCDVLGLRLDGVRDRGLMVIDDNDKMITARVYPKMVLIQTKIVAPRKLIISAKGMTPIELDFATLAEQGPMQDVHTAVWATKLDAMRCGKKYDTWFSQAILGKESGLRLVYYPHPKPVRQVQLSIAKEPHVRSEDTGAFNDTTSYVMMNLSSIKDLNTRIPRPAHPLQFRGNFYLKMDKHQPYAEDKWQWVKIGDDKIFRVVAPCTRCIFPNINVFTGERDPECQPSKMLKSYRKWPQYPNPALGIHLGLRQPGQAVKLHDVVYVEDH